MDHRAGAALTAICFKYGPLEYSQRLKHKGASDEQVYKILAQCQDNKNLDENTDKIRENARIKGVH